MVTRSTTDNDAAAGLAGSMAFATAFMADLKGAAAGTMTSIGVRLGWFAALDELGPCTSGRLAERVGAREVYVREWLLALSSAGYLETDAAAGTFGLPAAAATVLAREDSPFYLGGVARLLPPMCARLEDWVADLPVAAGLAQADYPDELFEAMRRTHTSWLTRMLVGEWLPGVPGLADRLTAGIPVSHVNCGSGAALVLLALEYPRCRFTGYDPLPANLTAARAAATEAGVADRIEFRATEGWLDLEPDQGLVIALDTLHETADPTAALTAVRTALAAEGVLLLLEPDGAENPMDDRGDAVAVLYATSVLYTVPTTLARGGHQPGMMSLPAGALAARCESAGLRPPDPLLKPGPFNMLYVLRRP
jgi:SAM-dependent methyltransferase